MHNELEMVLAEVMCVGSQASRQPSQYVCCAVCTPTHPAACASAQIPDYVLQVSIFSLYMFISALTDTQSLNYQIQRPYLPIAVPHQLSISINLGCIRRII